MNKPIGNILLVANYESDVGFSWWLMENFWATIAQEFSSDQSKVHLIFPRLGSVPAAISDAPIELHEINYEKCRHESREALKHFVKRHNIKTVYLTDKPSFDIFYLRLRLWGVRTIVVHCHRAGGDSRNNPLIRFGKSVLNRLPWVSCDHMLGVSEFVANRLVSNGCVPRRKCTAIVNGIVPIERKPECRRWVHEQLSIPGDAIIVISSGRAVLSKGIDFIIQCAVELIARRRLENLYFIYCGSGPDLEQFQRLVRDADLGRFFIFAGHRTDVKCLLQGCQIGFHASDCEAFSLSVLEYLSAGLATLAPAVCGNIEAIQNGETGYLYPYRNLDVAVDLIQRLVSDAECRNRIGANAAESVTRKFNIERTNRDLIKCLRAILG